MNTPKRANRRIVGIGARALVGAMLALTVAVTGVGAATYVYHAHRPSDVLVTNIDGACSIDYFNSKKTVVGYGPYVWAADKNTTIRNSQLVKVRPVLQRWNANTGAWGTLTVGAFTQLRAYDDAAAKFPNKSFPIAWSAAFAYYRVAYQVYWLGAGGVTEKATTVYGLLYRTVIPGADPIYTDTWNGWCSE